MPLRRRLGLFARPLALFGLFGPGLVTANAGNDAGGITTYSVAGATYGHALLWVFPLITVSLVVVQEVCARMGAVTGKGLAALIRERFGVRWTVVVMLSFLIATLGTTASEFAGIAAATELFGIPRTLSVTLAALFVFYLVVFGTYARVERIFVLMTVVFFAYVATALVATSDWRPVLAATVTPQLRLEPAYLFLLITLIGTTVTSYMQFFVQSTVVERGVTVRTLRNTRIDVIASSIFADVIAFFIVVTTAETLYRAGISIDSAADAARALAPLAGQYAQVLFAIGLTGASLLAASVLPLSAAFAVAEAFGFEAGISRRFSEAPVFMGLYVSLVIVGAAIVLLPGLPLIGLLVTSQFIDGLLLPVTLVSIAILAGDRAIMGAYASGGFTRAVQWTTAIGLALLSLVFVVLSARQLLSGGAA